MTPALAANATQRFSNLVVTVVVLSSQKKKEQYDISGPKKNIPNITYYKYNKKVYYLRNCKKPKVKN